MKDKDVIFGFVIFGIALFAMLLAETSSTIYASEAIPALTINNHGNVGIGIMDSQYNLHVVGDVGVGNLDIFDEKSVFGKYGGPEGNFRYPSGIAIDSTNSYVYVVDTNNNRIQVFDPSGNYVFKFGSAGNGTGQFSFPHGITTDSTNSYVYVADAGNHRIQVFDPSGNYTSTIGSEGRGTGQFSFPTSVATNSTDYIFVSDTNNNRIQVFDPSGNYTSTIGSVGNGTGQFSMPRGIATNSTDYIFVADGANNRIQVFDPSGNYVFKFGSVGNGTGQFSFPTDIAINPTTGDLYVTDYMNNRIQIFNSTGGFKSTFGSNEIHYYEIHSPHGIAVNPTNGELYVTEDVYSKVHIFTPIPQLFINDEGIGIGTLNPEALLTIGSGENQDMLLFNSERPWLFSASGTGEDTKLSLQTTVDRKEFRILSQDGHNDPLRVITANTNDDNEVILVWNGGRVGIGTTGPTKSLDVNGDGIANNWIQRSGQKWKTDISPLDDTLDKVMQLRGITYKWKVDEFPEKSFDDSVQIGLVAEQLESVYPELVHTTENGDKAIDYGRLVPILIEAIKEQQESIEKQQDILEQLKIVICPDHPQLSACQ